MLVVRNVLSFHTIPSPFPSPLPPLPPPTHTNMAGPQRGGGGGGGGGGWGVGTGDTFPGPHEAFIMIFLPFLAASSRCFAFLALSGLNE